MANLGGVGDLLGQEVCTPAKTSAGDANSFSGFDQGRQDVVQLATVGSRFQIA